MKITKFGDAMKNRVSMDYTDYFKKIHDDLKSLIEVHLATDIKDESAIQEYFEKYPSTLLGAISGIQSNYKVEGNLIISQPRLKSVERDRQPDFLIITGNSLQLFFNFIEIEAPVKKIFHPKKYELSKDFFDSYNQLAAWRSSQHSAIEEYCKYVVNTLFRGNDNFKQDRKHHYNYILLYGDSKEVHDRNDNSYNDLLQSLFNNEFQHVTYSRLMKARNFVGPLICVKKTAEIGQFVAIGADPFKDYTLDSWLDHHNIREKEELVRKAELLSDVEKDTLIAKIEKFDKMDKNQIWKLEHNKFDSLDVEDL